MSPLSFCFTLRRERSQTNQLISSDAHLIFSFYNILASCRIVKTKIGCWLYLKSGDQFWEAQAQSLSPFLCHLKVVKIQNLKDMKHEGVINIARFLLEHGRDLQEMIFVLQKYKDYYIPVDITAAWTKDDIGIIEGLPQGSTNVKFSYLIAN